MCVCVCSLVDIWDPFIHLTLNNSEVRKQCTTASDWVRVVGSESDNNYRVCRRTSGTLQASVIGALPGKYRSVIGGNFIGIYSSVPCNIGNVYAGLDPDGGALGNHKQGIVLENLYSSGSLIRFPGHRRRRRAESNAKASTSTTTADKRNANMLYDFEQRIVALRQSAQSIQDDADGGHVVPSVIGLRAELSPRSMHNGAEGILFNTAGTVVQHGVFSQNTGSGISVGFQAVNSVIGGVLQTPFSATTADVLVEDNRLNGIQVYCPTIFISGIYVAKNAFTGILLVPYWTTPFVRGPHRQFDAMVQYSNIFGHTRYNIASSCRSNHFFNNTIGNANVLSLNAGIEIELTTRDGFKTNSTVVRNDIQNHVAFGIALIGATQEQVSELTGIATANLSFTVVDKITKSIPAYTRANNTVRLNGQGFDLCSWCKCSHDMMNQEVRDRQRDFIAAIIRGGIDVSFYDVNTTLEEYVQGQFSRADPGVETPIGHFANNGDPFNIRVSETALCNEKVSFRIGSSRAQVDFVAAGAEFCRNLGNAIYQSAGIIGPQSSRIRNVHGDFIGSLYQRPSNFPEHIPTTIKSLTIRNLRLLEVKYEVRWLRSALTGSLAFFKRACVALGVPATMYRLTGKG